MRVDLARGEKPEGPYGIVFVEAESGAGEYWHVKSALDTQGEHYQVDPSHRWLQWQDFRQGRTIVADRETGNSYDFDLDRWALVAGPSPEGVMVLFRIGTDQFAVVHLVEDPLSVSLNFSLPRGEVAPGMVPISPQGTLLSGGNLLLLDNFLVDLSTGEVTERRAALDGSAPATFVAFASEDGGWLEVDIHVDPISPQAVAQRYDAGGKRIELDTDPSLRLLPSPVAPFPSPDGRWLVLGTTVNLQSPAMTEVWPAFTLEDLRDQETVLRDVRASTLRGGAWLSDSSGVVVATPNGFSILRTDGSATPLPFGPVERSGVGGVAVPVPAPNDAELFLYNGEVIRANGEVLSPAIAAADWASNSPWNEYGFSPDGAELRFVQSPPPGGDIGLTVLTAFGLPARVERPPFPDEVRMQVDTAGDTLNLRDFPSTDGQILAQLRDGDLLTVTNGSGEREPATSAWPDEASADPDTFAWAYDVPWWVHVRMADGVEGWVRSEFVAWAD